MVKWHKKKLLSDTSSLVSSWAGSCSGGGLEEEALPLQVLG